MTITDVVNEARAILAEQLETGGRIEAQWVVHELMRRHSRIEGEDKAFYVLAGYGLCQRAVKMALRRPASPKEHDDEEESDSGPMTQMVLPGYEYLQVAYLIPRNGKQEIVAVADMTDDEIEAKAEEHQRLAKGNEQHAEELRRYKSTRHSPPAVA